MGNRRGRCGGPHVNRTLMALGVIGAVMLLVACETGSNQTAAPVSASMVRIGVAQLSYTSQINGLRQLTSLHSLEGLARPGDDGRMQPWLAESWTLSRDGRSLILTLRSDVKFHDGSPLDAATVAAILPGLLRSTWGVLADNVERVTATGTRTVEILFKAPSPLTLEELEVPIQKPGKTPIGTGAFAVREGTTELRANRNYYLGPPTIDGMTVSNYPNVRAAWAEMLRNNLDMLYEVGPEAVNSLEGSSTISTFSYTRHYQHLVMLNTRAAVFRSKDVRRALNMALDRDAVVKNALNGYGVTSSAPLSPRHWALAGNSPHFRYDPKLAAQILGHPSRSPALTFTCLVGPNSLEERIALEVKRQLAIVNVDMKVEEASRDEITRRSATGDYEAAVLEFISGPTMIRPFIVWHPSANGASSGNATIESALDRVRRAPDDEEYRRAIIGVQQAFVDDPPAIFLAWSVRARAISKRFVVPAAEPGRDVLSILRLWRPAGDSQYARNN